MNSKALHQRTRAAFSYVKGKGYNVAYIGLYGSQNYRLDMNDKDYQSDVDWKCIVIPTLEQLVMNSQPISIVIPFGGGQIDVKDIRAFTDSIVKCNVNFLEILTTEFFYCTNPEVKDLRKMVEPLMKEMGALYLKACYGMMKEKEAALRHPYPSTKHKVEKYGYDPKQYHHIARLALLIERYVECERKHYIFKLTTFSHFGSEQEKLIKIKKGLIPNDKVDAHVKELMDYAKRELEGYTTIMKFDAKDDFIQQTRNIIINDIVGIIQDKSYGKPSLKKA